jgi:hypothetical protein
MMISSTKSQKSPLAGITQALEDPDLAPVPGHLPLRHIILNALAKSPQSDKISVSVAATRERQLPHETRVSTEDYLPGDPWVFRAV